MTTTDRASFQGARNAGLAKRQATRVAGRTQCHVVNDLGVRCSAEIADPLADRGFCTRHLAELLSYAADLQIRIANRSAS